MRKEASFVSVATAVTLGAMVLSGGMYVGSMAQEVEQLKKDVTEIEKIREDVTTIKVTQATLIAQQSAALIRQATQQETLNKILEKLED